MTFEEAMVRSGQVRSGRDGPAGSAAPAETHKQQVRTCQNTAEQSGYRSTKEGRSGRPRKVGSTRHRRLGTGVISLGPVSSRWDRCHLAGTGVISLGPVSSRWDRCHLVGTGVISLGPVSSRWDRCHLAGTGVISLGPVSSRSGASNRASSPPAPIQPAAWMLFTKMLWHIDTQTGMDGLAGFVFATHPCQRKCLFKNEQSFSHYADLNTS